MTEVTDMPDDAARRPRLRALATATTLAAALLVILVPAAAPADADPPEPPPADEARPDAPDAPGLALYVPPGMDRELVDWGLQTDLGSGLAGSFPLAMLEALAVLDPEGFGATPEEAYRRFGWLFLEGRPRLPVGIVERRALGMRVHNFNCLACHAGEEPPATPGGRGHLIIGATNRTVAFADWYGEVIGRVRQIALQATAEAGLDLDERGPEGTVASICRTLKREAAIAKVVARFIIAARRGLRARGSRLELLDAIAIWMSVRSLADDENGPPEPPPPERSNGPGRTIVAGAYRALRFGLEPGPFAPIKPPDLFGVPYRESLLWAGVEVHPEGRSPAEQIGRNGMLVPWIQMHPLTRRPVADRVTIARMRRYLKMGELLAASKPPPAPAPTTDAERALMKRGAVVYGETCSDCHGSYRLEPETRPDGGPGLRSTPVDYEEVLIDIEEIGTDPAYGRSLDQDFLDAFLATEFAKQNVLGLRETNAFVARPHLGLRLRAPFLHNGSVPNLRTLLTPPAERPDRFAVGWGVPIDRDAVGLALIEEAAGSTAGDGRWNTRVGQHLRDARVSGNRATGHPFGTDLPEADKRALLEYLKRL